MAPAAAIGLVSEAMRKMVTPQRRRVVDRGVPEHFRVHVGPARHEGHQSGYGALLDVRGETVVQPFEPGAVECGPAGHDRSQRARTAMCSDASGRVRAWRRSATSSGSSRGSPR